MWASPLVRGLLAAPGEDQLHRRIIPARAGFTAAPTSPTASGPDHPRSRGVYRTTRTGTSRRSGSSPLARGLRRPRRLPHGGYGIIPARAGFTRRRRRHLRGRRDHPRSRGVYLAVSTAIITAAGSSPLARGLPHSAGCVSTTTRIIPARAGFTYSTDATVPATVGSSPLARGLPNRAATCPAGTGIIPARAGFTFAESYLNGTLRDHPRSRGVYHKYGPKPM